jgi:putative transposase
VKEQRRTFHRQIAARLVREYDLIAAEDLNIVGLAKGMLARDVHGAGWSAFIDALANAAARACRKLVKVDPRRTSQTCPICGRIKPKTLSERIHRCDCGYTADRDVAAAQIILNKAVVGLGLDKPPVAAA